MPKTPTPDLTPDEADTTTPETPQVDWEAEYRKLQNSYNGKKGHAEQLNARNQTLIQEKDQYLVRISELETALDAKEKTYSSQLQEASERATKAEQTAKQLQRQREVSQFIRKEFPSLSEFEDVLRVDDLEGDALKQYLGEFASRFTGVVETKTSNKMAGSTPPPPKPQGNKPTSLAELRTQLDDTAKLHGTRSKEYRMVEQAYTNALDQGATE